ncbi:MAG: polysaccharide biosynthesis/export family protein [Deltaproteobacteria bacterium]|nr:polysaccharide biosynthesis/export family protein [Deltaproteobacteria bacterium]
MQDSDMKKIRNIPLMVVLVVGMGSQVLLAANQPTVIDTITGVPTQMQGGLPASARKNMNTVSQTTPGGYPLQGAAPPQMYMEKSMRPTVMDAPPAWAQDKLPPAASLVLAPFGANLFQGNFAGTYSDGMNEDYIIMPGDRITVRIWGAKTYEDVLAVDQQGNIFMPEIGPVHVAGIRQSALQGTMRSKLATVFTDNVELYVNLQSAQPVAVYVTGFVNRPGRYAGAAVDSVMSYLDRAGGITPNRGTYRAIKVKRGNLTVAVIDLYDFALNGNMPQIRLKDGDVILVGERGASVTAYGMLRQEARYEFTNVINGMQLIRFGRPISSATHVSVSGIRQGRPFNQYVSLEDFKTMRLADGDSVEFVADVRGRTIMTAVNGAIHGKSRFPIRNNTTLRSLLAYVRVDPALADTSSVYVRRQSVAQQQKAILVDSLRRLEHSTLTATSATAEEAQIRMKEAELVQDFVKRAASLTPDGVVVVSRNGRINDLLLEDGDLVVIPQKSDVVQVSGEVMIPKAVTFDASMTEEDYLKSAGGFTDRADKSNILIARMNGEVGPIDELGIHAGDRILVMPRVDTKNIELAKGITQILYQIAVATKVAVGL